MSAKDVCRNNPARTGRAKISHGDSEYGAEVRGSADTLLALAPFSSIHAWNAFCEADLSRKIP
jgi:hypothetical protein